MKSTRSNTRSTKVNLTKRVIVRGEKRYCPVVVSANGRIKPDYVLVNGVEERHPEGAYYIDWTEAGKGRQRESVGPDASTAHNRRLKKEATFTAIANGLFLIEEKTVTEPIGTTLADASATFLEETRLTKKPKTISAYTTAVAYFLESFQKDAEVRTLDSLERMHMLQFASFLRVKKGLAPRTCRNVFGNVMTFLKSQGVTGVAKKGDWPRFVQAEVEIYEKEDLARLYAFATETERLWWDFFLMTGMREQEVMYSDLRDLNLKEATVTVRFKAEYGWSPKAYKEREIPVPAKLIESLEHHFKQTPRKAGCKLIFFTKGCKPMHHFRELLRANAERAGLNPNEFWLHKFRATFATWSLWAGVDLRTVQQWLGHSDMESTLRYLKPARNQTVRDKVNEIFA